MTDVITTVSAIGIDLGDRDAYYVCLDESGEKVEEGRVAMTRVAFERTFGSFEPTRIAIEAGAQSRWVA
ncbi:MAG: hypothetical protein JNN08_15880, partial [Bryobacterales bacterium]|nr:hypothetical protein [Bryobacterales bacterium]